MTSEAITIGGLSRRSGVPVKTLRFYSDEGLLPPAGRTAGGYRVYAEDAVARLDLIRTLREAGLGLAAIRAILARDLTLADALRLRLRAVEAHITSLQHVAAALRVALRSDPTSIDLERLSTVQRLTTDHCKAAIERFHARVAEGVEDAAKRQIMAAYAPRLPDDPTSAQLDAWIALAELVQDEAFVAAMQAGAADPWLDGLDPVAHRQVVAEASAAARGMLDRGVPPTDPAAGPVVDRMVAGLAAAAGRPDDPAFRAAVRAHNVDHDPRLVRYWELAGVLAGGGPPVLPGDEWRWLSAASQHHLDPSRA